MLQTEAELDNAISMIDFLLSQRLTDYGRGCLEILTDLVYEYESQHYKERTMNLLIQNPGVAPVEAYTLLGASGSRGNRNVNGQFGTGNKLGITAILRRGLSVKVYAGTNRITFGAREVEFDDSPVKRVTVSINNRKPVDTGWTLDWGAIDWTTVDMGLRELIANALDASIKGNGYTADLETGDLFIGLTDEAPRAKAGFTRVYIEASAAVERYVEELPKRFLHFSDTPLDQEILPKANRSLSNSDRAMVYRMGVWVCELNGDSIYDYNFGPDDIAIDECRNSNEYSVRATIAKRIRRATAEELTPIFEAIGADCPSMESKLDPYYLCPTWHTPSEDEIRQWQAAWKQSFGNAVMTDGQSRSLEYVHRKGYAAQQVNSAGWRDVMQKLGIKADSDVLSAGELLGRTVVGVDTATWERFQGIWSTAAGLTNGKAVPTVACFKEDSPTVQVYVENDTVFIRQGLCCPEISKAALAGIAEYVTGSGSLTSKFEDWILSYATQVP